MLKFLLLVVCGTLDVYPAKIGITLEFPDGILCSNPGKVQIPSGQIQGERIKGTNLYTDTWYRINLKSNNGLLTWSYDKTDVGYHIQIVFGSAANEYGKDERYWNHGLWMLKSSEVSGRHVLVNKGLPTAAITWCCQAPNGKWVVAADGLANSTDYSAGGKYRQDNLWRFESDSGDSNSRYYSIYNARYPSTNIMTWAQDNRADTKFVQIYDGITPDSKTSMWKWEHNKDYLWEFTTAVEQ